MLAQKDPQAKATRAGFLEGFHLAHAHVHAEFVAFTRYRLGVASTHLHGKGHHVGGQGLKVQTSQFGLCYGFGHESKVTKWSECSLNPLKAKDQNISLCGKNNDAAKVGHLAGFGHFSSRAPAFVANEPLMT